MSAADGRTPAAQGFAMPAEWERHEATWLSFPHNAADWPGKFAPVPWAYAEIVRWAAEGELVRLIVKDATHEKSARRVLERSGVALDRVQFLRWPTDRGWMRDTGPIWVTRPGGKAIARFRFDGWSKYPNWKKDVKLPERAAARLDAELLPILHDGRPVVLEGGAIDVNGAGTLLTTEECLLDPAVQVRNPGFAREDYEVLFRDALGARNTVWLGRGIAGDDTHGHVDDLARFVDARTIVLVREDDPKDANYGPLEENRERLQGARLQDGSRPQLAYLPMPGPVVFDGQRLPASYANFYVANAAVLVPTFDDPADREALGILGELFKDRPVVGIHARDLVWGLGTIHCLSQQEPAVPI
ncbi:MAG TPA: agmatine deiminase family protein [Anaeromyxobacteraceae bacterium]|nr:agmatine deiminase family protein [Anaeromyxobacteraceae bacterium]